MIQMPIMGTIHSMMKTQQLQMKWQQRKENPNMPKGDKVSAELEQLRTDAERVRKSNIISSIDGKLKAGYKLSSEEMDYLRVNSPELYKKAVEVAMEREQYRKALENCKTKEEVERLKTNKMQGFLSHAKSVSSNPNISQGKKRDILDQITRRMMGITSEQVAFTSTPQYANLPREAELEDEKARKKEKPVAEIEQDDDPERLYLEKEAEPTEHTAPAEDTAQGAAAEKPPKTSEPAKQHTSPSPVTGVGSKRSGADSGAEGTPATRTAHTPRPAARPASISLRA